VAGAEEPTLSSGLRGLLCLCSAKRHYPHLWCGAVSPLAHPTSALRSCCQISTSQVRSHTSKLQIPHFSTSALKDLETDLHPFPLTPAHGISLQSAGFSSSHGLDLSERPPCSCLRLQPHTERLLWVRNSKATPDTLLETETWVVTGTLQSSSLLTVHPPHIKPCMERSEKETPIRLCSVGGGMSCCWDQRTNVSPR
jgi:hypothetical protein